VVDAYESMTSGRPYRQAMSHDEAVRELRRCVGSQFDAKVVDAFTQLFGGQKITDMIRAPEAA
jgi:HD-GYP domain-containing protein (c-di-GMP phosphodiesterase class II)